MSKYMFFVVIANEVLENHMFTGDYLYNIIANSTGMYIVIWKSYQYTKTTMMVTNRSY